MRQAYYSIDSVGFEDAVDMLKSKDGISDEKLKKYVVQLNKLKKDIYAQLSKNYLWD